MTLRNLAFCAIAAAFTGACAAVQPAGVLPAAGTEYVFVGSGGGETVGEVTTYRLDRATGALTRIDRKEVGGLASYIAPHPRLPVLYVTAERGGQMHWVGIDPATGILTPMGARQSNGNPVYTSVDATGTRLLGVNYGQGTTDVFPLDPATGAIAGDPVNHATGRNTHSAVFHPTNRWVYAAAVADNHIAQYEFRNGALVPLSPPTVAQEGGARHITMHPNGNYAYAVAGATDNVFSFRVGAEGRLAPMGSARRLPASLSAEAGTHMGSDIHLTPDGRFAYAANRGQNNTLAIYSVAGNGELTLRGHESTRGSTPRTFAIDPAGELLLVGNQDSQTVAVFRIDRTTGGLTHLRTETVGVNPWFVGVWRVGGG
jgi:6-phosphogluconolactonase